VLAAVGWDPRSRRDTSRISPTRTPMPKPPRLGTRPPTGYPANLDCFVVQDEHRRDRKARDDARILEDSVNAAMGTTAESGKAWTFQARKAYTAVQQSLASRSSAAAHRGLAV